MANKWPSTLPPPRKDSYQLNFEQNFIRTEMDQGNARQRKRFTRTRATIPLVWRFKETQLATFEAWFHYQINDGVSWFEMTLWNGQGFNPYQVRFTKAPQAKAVGGNLFDVAAELEVFVLKLMPKNNLVFYL